MNIMRKSATIATFAIIVASLITLVATQTYSDETVSQEVEDFLVKVIVGILIVGAALWCILQLWAVKRNTKQVVIGAIGLAVFAIGAVAVLLNGVQPVVTSVSQIISQQINYNPLGTKAFATLIGLITGFAIWIASRSWRKNSSSSRYNVSAAELLGGLIVIMSILFFYFALAGWI